MSAGSANFLEIQPSELAFPFELMKQSSCSMQLTNKTDHYVAFKVKTTNPKQYCVRPNIGVVLPGSTCDVTVTMQAQREAPTDLQCKDKFLVQSVAAENGAATQDITAPMFNKEPGKVVDECKLRVIYVPTSIPGSISEESEQGSSARSFENGTPNSTMPQTVFRSSTEPAKEKSVEVSLSLYLTFMNTYLFDIISDRSKKRLHFARTSEQLVDCMSIILELCYMPPLRPCTN
jgi:hypothetical protein